MYDVNSRYNSEDQQVYIKHKKMWMYSKSLNSWCSKRSTSCYWQRCSSGIWYLGKWFPTFQGTICLPLQRLFSEPLKMNVKCSFITSKMP